jgi:hypothetical protein
MKTSTCTRWPNYEPTIRGSSSCREPFKEVFSEIRWDFPILHEFWNDTIEDIIVKQVERLVFVLLGHIIEVVFQRHFHTIRNTQLGKVNMSATKNEGGENLAHLSIFEFLKECFFRPLHSRPVVDSVFDNHRE